MKHGRVILLFCLCAISSGSLGFWFGFREALTFGVAADFLPRGTVAVTYLNEIRAGKTDSAIIGLEFDVDNGLIWGHDLFQHPLRGLVGPFWDFDFYPRYEKFAVRLANYRKNHPTFMKEDMFDVVPHEQEGQREFYRELSVGTRENAKKVNSMVERYARKP